MPEGLCPDAEMTALLERAGRGDARGLAQVEASLARYERDARLHFLKGSLLASQQMYVDAQSAMMHALSLDPNYWIVRFQLGLLQLSSGDADRARATWANLHEMPADHYITLFVRGLEAMIADDFARATELLNAGVAANTELPAVNHDMKLLLESMKEKAAATAAKGAADAATQAEPTSAAHFLLNVFKQKGRPH